MKTICMVSVSSVNAISLTQTQSLNSRLKLIFNCQTGKKLLQLVLGKQGFGESVLNEKVPSKKS